MSATFKVGCLGSYLQADVVYDAGMKHFFKLDADAESISGVIGSRNIN